MRHPTPNHYGPPSHKSVDLVRMRQNIAHQDVDTLVVAYLTAEAKIATHRWTLHAASQPVETDLVHGHAAIACGVDVAWA